MIELPREMDGKVKLISVSEDKHGMINVQVEIIENLSPGDRGTLLLDLEDKLVKSNPSVRVWHTPIGDKNSLRNLRGVKIQ